MCKFDYVSIIILCLISQVFNGNQDSQSVVSHKLRQAITARYIRFKPLTPHGSRLGMRTEIYGCLGIVQILFYTGYVVGNRFVMLFCYEEGEFFMHSRLNEERPWYNIGIS